MNNLKTLFHVKTIPKDTRMREVIDEVDPEEITPLFDDFFRPLQRGKHLEQYLVLGRYIIADGLYSKQPTIQKVLALHMDYLLVAKPDDHEMLMEWVNEQRALKWEAYFQKLFTPFWSP